MFERGVGGAPGFATICQFDCGREQVMDYANFKAGENGYGPTSNGINAQLANEAGKAFADSTRPAFGAATNAALPATPNFGGAPYYGSPATPFPTGIVGWILLPIIGYFFARAQTEVLAMAGVLGMSVLGLASRVLQVPQRPTLWQSFKAACLGMAAYLVVKRLGTPFVPQDTLLDAVGVIGYAAVMTYVLRANLKGLAGFLKACAIGAANVFLVVVGMGLVGAFTHH